jgi:hypothetical protein
MKKLRSPHATHSAAVRVAISAVTILAGLSCCLGTAEAKTTRNVEAARASAQVLYVLVNHGRASYVELYPAYGKNSAPIGTITKGVSGNPSALWIDPQGNLFVANALTYHSYVAEYAPSSDVPMRVYKQGVDLPFGGTAVASGAMHVSNAGAPDSGFGVAVYPPGTLQPARYLTKNVHVPHGVDVDASGDVFVADIYGSTETSVVEFPGGSPNGVVLPLDKLAHGSGAFLEDLKLDAQGEIAVADAGLNTVRFYPKPYGHERRALTVGLSAPTGLAYGPDGSLFVGNEYVNSQNGNVVIFAPGSNVPTRTLTNGIAGGVLGVAVGPDR